MAGTCALFACAPPRLTTLYLTWYMFSHLAERIRSSSLPHDVALINAALVSALAQPADAARAAQLNADTRCVAHTGGEPVRVAPGGPQGPGLQLRWRADNADSAQRAGVQLLAHKPRACTALHSALTPARSRELTWLFVAPDNGVAEALRCRRRRRRAACRPLRRDTRGGACTACGDVWMPT